MNASDISPIFPSGNSSSTPLAGGATFTGPWEDCHHYEGLSASAWADVASAASGFRLQFSNDAANVVCEENTTIGAGSGDVIQATVCARYFRIVYTNGAAAQVAFSLEVLKTYIKANQSNITGTVAATIADGADVCEGATTDAASTAGTTGTLSAKLRGLTTSLAAALNAAIPNRAALIAAEDVSSGNLIAIRSKSPALAAINNSQLLAAGVMVNLPAANYAPLCGTWNANFDRTVDNVPRLHVLAVQCAQTEGDAVKALRTPAIFHTVAAAAAGNTALWAPPANRRFRLMRYLVEITGDATLAAAAVLTISLFDGAAGATGQVHSVYVPAAAPAAPNGVIYNSGWIDLGNGYSSAALANVLNVNLSAALTAGVVRVIACGTEET